ncbi:MAG: spore coat associated protein CotJA [Oscillospiraceae bacterium]|nr:spore coat associated protein CotJA [Oscillospiraceae bacterium]
MAYVPFQTNTERYDAEKALCQGTLFPTLNKPFLGGKCI